MSDRVFCDISISADGYLAGPAQTADKPFGDGPVDRLHAWMFDTPDENKAEIDRVVSAGAFVMGRNMFGPIRGDWDPSWRGWWGEDPPYHAPVFALTPATRWRCRAAPPSGSSPTASTPPWSRRARRRGIATSPSPAARPRSTSSLPPGHPGGGRTPLRRRPAAAAGARGRQGRVARHPHQLPRPPLRASSGNWCRGKR